MIFHILSGLVGVSVGVFDKAYSLSGNFSHLGKLMVILTFYMGKNRAMPKLSDPVIHFKFPQLEKTLVKYSNKLEHATENPMIKDNI
jgi:Trk-type K+ transport system membrane component